MKVALCQFNPFVGAVAENSRRLLDYAHEAAALGSELFFAPELALCGYPPKDLIGNSDFQALIQAELESLAKNAPIAMIMGAPDYGSFRARQSNPERAFNAAVYCFESKIQIVARKQLLPNYQVFDEKRYFKPGAYAPPFNSLGITICEDAWNDAEFWPNRRYDLDPVYELNTRDNPDVLVTMMASPFELGKADIREAMFAHMAKRYAKPVLVVGQVGGNDGLIFDGGSMAINAQGVMTHQAQKFREELLICKI